MPTLQLILLFALLTAPALFSELRRPPEKAVPALPPVLVDEQGKPVESRAAWKGVRDRLKREWSAILGPFPERPPLDPQVLSTENLPDHTRILLRYPIEPGVDSEAYLLIPKNASGAARGRKPGMVVLHQTTDETIRQSVGISGREQMHIALHLVRRGYVCIAPRNFLWSDPTKEPAQVTRELLARRPWKTGMARMLWDALRATDLLCARREVDPRRIGSIGHSLGGKEVIYHAAFDERIRAAVSCEGGVGLRFSNWDADWYLGAQIHAPGFWRDHQEVVALIAPRPFLLVGGESADGAQSWPYIAVNLPVWRLLGAEERLGLLRHNQGHDFPAPGPDRERIYLWLDHWLENGNGSGDDQPRR